MARGKHLINVHTGTGTTEPSGASLYLGEIAVQHTPEEPALWIKVGTSEDSEVYEKFIGKTEITNIFNDTKILGSGYTYSGLPYVNSATTLADAYSALTSEVILDEKITSAALNDLNDRVREISAATGDITEMVEYIQENEEVVAGALNNLNDRVATVETHMTGDYIPLEGYVLASGLTEEELMITSADTVNEAFGKIQKQNLDNEEAIAASLNDLNDRVLDLSDEISHNTGVTVLSGVVADLVDDMSGLRALSSATQSLSSATRSLSSATQFLSGVVRTISGKTNGVLTLTMNGVEQGKYSPSASTTINLEAIQDVTGADVLLTGYELASGTTEEELAIVATDTVNEAFGKIQKQNYDNEAVIAGAMNHFNEILLGFSGIIIDDEYVTASALNDLDSRLDVVEESTTGVSGLSEDIQALSASVEDFEEIAAAAFNDLNDRIEALSASSVDPSIMQAVEALSSHVETNEFVTAAALNDLNARVIELSGNSVDTALTLDVQELSGVVIDLQAEVASSSGLAALSAAVVTISGQVSANTTNIEALSGKVLNNDLVIAAIFNDLNDRVIELSGDTNEEILDILAKIDEISGNTGGGGGGADLGPLSASVVTNKNNITALSAGTTSTLNNKMDKIVSQEGGYVVRSTTNGNLEETDLSAGNIIHIGNNVLDGRTVVMAGGDVGVTSLYDAGRRNTWEHLYRTDPNWEPSWGTSGQTSLHSDLLSIGGLANNANSQAGTARDEVANLSAATTAHTADTSAHVSATDRLNWNGKQPRIDDLSTIRTNAASGMAAYNNVDALSAATTAMSANVAKIAVTGVTVTGTGNAVTNAAYANSALTLTKGNVLTAETLTGVSAGGTNVTVTNKIAAIPSASTNTFGVVKTGNFITNTNGSIAVTTGTNSTSVARGDHSHSGYATTTDLNNLSAVTVTGVSAGGTNVTVTNKVAAIPSASTNTFGVVKTGNFITNTNGSIAVTTGTNATSVARGDHSHSGYATTGTLNTHTAVTIANGTSSQMHLPTVSAANNGKILRVVNGAWALVDPVTVYSGSNAPDPSMGTDGDIYLQTS